MTDAQHPDAQHPDAHHPDAHLDLDALADVLADEPPVGALAHLEGCATCAGALLDLEAAMVPVAAALATLPEPELPADLGARLKAALAQARADASTDTAADADTATDADTASPAVLDASPTRALPTVVLQADDDASTSSAGTTTAARTIVPGDAGAEVTPIGARRDRTRWLPWAGGIAAAAVLVLGAGVVSNNIGGGGSSADSTAAGTAEGSVADLIRNDTGTNYARDGKALAAALPVLLGNGQRAVAPADNGSDTAGTSASNGPAPGSVAAPRGSAQATAGGEVAPLTTPQFSSKALDSQLALLRTTDGLASCLSALTDPGTDGVPLAIDYAAYEGKPAMVVVLPSTRAGKVDVFVVGAGCRPADAQVLLFTRLTRP